MSEPQAADLTRLLQDVQGGAPAAREALFEAAYAQLRRIAGALMRQERPGHTLQPTELVHDAWLKLVDRHGSPGRTGRTS